MATIYSIVSGKGGVGKTTSCINLGAALNKTGEEVIIVDANLTTPNIGLHLGAPIVPITLNHVLSKNMDITDAIYEHYSGLKILPSSLSIEELKNIDYNKFHYLQKLKNFAAHILLDSSAGLGRETKFSMRAADEIILITNAEMPAVTDALKTAKLAEKLKKPVKGFILTRHKGKKTEMSIENIKDMLELELLGIVPEDKNINKSLSLKDAVVHTHPYSKSSKAYNDIARKISGQIDNNPDSFYKRFLRKIRL